MYILLQKLLIVLKIEVREESGLALGKKSKFFKNCIVEEGKEEKSELQDLE